MGEINWLQQLARRLGGPRLLVLPFIRGLTVLAAFLWLALIPSSFPHRGQLTLVIAGFATYSLLLYILIWFYPRSAFRLHLPVLLVDLTFALVLIYFSGGAESVLYLALLLIAGLQSYYYGIRRGITVAVGAAVAYAWVAWPTMSQEGVANVAIRVAVLVGTAVAIGVLGDVEERERLEVAALNMEVRTRERFITNMVESLRDGLVALDREGRVEAWNRAMVERYDIRPEEVLGQKWLDRFPNMRREGLAEPIERLLRGEIEEFPFGIPVAPLRNERRRP